MDLAFFGFALLAATGVALAAMSFNLPGTTTPGIVSGNDGPRYDVAASITACASALGEGTLENFRYETEEHSLFGSIFVSPKNLLAFGGVNNARVRLEVNKNGSELFEQTEYLGEIGAGQCEVVRYKFGNLPAGKYQLDFVYLFNADIFSFTKQDSFQTTITVPEAGEAF